jgi:predicted aspartyl protease
MRLLGLLFAAAFAAIPLRAHADDAQSLLAKHKAFVGWQLGDGTIDSLILQGTMTYQKDGAAKTYGTIKELHNGLAHRTTIDSEDGGSDYGFTGRVFWETNENGFTHPIVGDPQKTSITEDLLFNEAISEMTGSVKGSATVDGTPCTFVQVQTQASMPLNVCIDATGAVKQAVIDPGGSYEETINVLAYADVLPGKKMISKWQFGGSKYTHEWTKMKANAFVSDDSLHPPAQTATWKFDGQPFPIQFKNGDRDKGFYVDAVFDGVRGHFLLDTGAAGIFLNKSFAGRIHMKPVRRSSAYGIGGSTNTEVGTVGAIQVGGNVLSHVIVTSLGYDMNGVDGAIGYDLFGGAIAYLNLDDQQLTLFDPNSMHVDNSGGILLSVDLSSEQPTIPMTINGNIPVNATLDSGDLLEVTFSKQLVGKYGLKMMVDDSLANITNAIRFARGAGGVEREECGHLDSISVGPVVYQNAPACKSPTFGGNSALVGFDFIKHFNIIFDYPHGQMLLIPRPNQE